MEKHITIYWLFIFVLTYTNQSGYAQYVQISGKVVDPNESPVPGATVRIVDTDLMDSTGVDGRYVIRGIPAGSYEIEAKFQGYIAAVQRVDLKAGELFNLDFRLRANISSEAIYKTRAPGGLLYVNEGYYQKAVQYFDSLESEYASLYPSHLDDYPADLEALFGLVLTYGQQKKMDKALEVAHKAVEQGLPLGRFRAGPRYLTDPLWQTYEFKKWTAGQEVALLHGPLLGKVDDNSAEFWVRTAHEVPVRVKISRSAPMGSSRYSEKGYTRSTNDFTGIIKVEQLKPATMYYYQLEVGGKLQAPVRSFRTFPEAGAPSDFLIGFGGGAGYTPWKERIWDTLATHQPLAFLMMGDNVYIDYPLYPDIQRYIYYRRQSRPEFVNFTSGSSIYAIWDDHDFRVDDTGGGPRTHTPNWKIPVWEVFKENWNNPSYGGGRSNPGVWFSFTIGDVEFFMLDVRYYRTPPDVDQPSMLGAPQKQWLFDQLTNSKATFKIIASGVPWAFDSKPGPEGLDTWRGYREERNEIFSFLAEEKIEGVVLLSADRHRSEIRKIEFEGLYPLYELESSHLTNIHTHPCVEGYVVCYNEKNSFGLLRFKTIEKDPELRYDIYNIDNEKVESFSIKRSKLKPGD